MFLSTLFLVFIKYFFLKVFETNNDNDEDDDTNNNDSFCSIL